MVDSALVRRRLVAQGLATRPFSSPHDAVAAFGAMQGQDLPGVMASIALRLSEPGGRFGLDGVVAAFDDGSGTITTDHLDAVPLSARAMAGEAELRAVAPQPSRRRRVKVPVS